MCRESAVGCRRGLTRPEVFCACCISLVCSMSVPKTRGVGNAMLNKDVMRSEDEDVEV
jgi:hypothetical protein